jgi:mannose/fructose/N-acetylgalactosamine-specific phosphotransferase system component IIC
MTYLWLALLGGILGLDIASWAQAMISRPIVAGPVAGLLLGDPEAGFWAGVLLEVLSLHQLPVGASRYWDTGPAAVAATAAFVSTGGPVALLVAVGFGVIVGWLGSWSVHGTRYLSARLVAVETRGSVTPTSLTARHLAAMASDLLRAAILTFVAVWSFPRLAVGLVGVPGLGDAVAALILLVSAGLTLGVDVRTMARGGRVWAAFGAGAALSAILALCLR